MAHGQLLNLVLYTFRWGTYMASGVVFSKGHYLGRAGIFQQRF